RHYNLKRILTSFYYFLNRAENDTEALDPHDKARLEEHYRPYNKELVLLLSGRQASLPGWLDQYSED
ncbi:MAG: hypothetical protein QGF90_08745, partial [Gammaproteobacteria bacterium]|nr:hypothetical protein [Gammaproteobacteria bacterium]